MTAATTKRTMSLVGLVKNLAEALDYVEVYSLSSLQGSNSTALAKSAEGSAIMLKLPYVPGTSPNCIVAHGRLSFRKKCNVILI